MFSMHMAVVPNLFDLATHSKILRKCSVSAITYKSKGVQISTDRIKNTIISHVRFTLFRFLCKKTAHMLISGMTELASLQLNLKFLGTCW